MGAPRREGFEADLPPPAITRAWVSAAPGPSPDLAALARRCLASPAGAPPLVRGVPAAAVAGPPRG